VHCSLKKVENITFHGKAHDTEYNKTSATIRVVGAKDGAMDGTTVGVDDGTPLGSADGTLEWRSVGLSDLT
jgi:hypothetical protein